MKHTLAITTVVAVLGLLAIACSAQSTPTDDSQGTPTPPSTPVPPTPTPAASVVPSDDLTDARISMRESGGMLGTVRVHDADSTLLNYGATFSAIAGLQEARIECSETTLPLEDQKQLWRTLYENDVFTLGDNHEMLSVIADDSFYEITVEHDGQRNEFSVYAPGTLSDRLDGRYRTIVNAMGRLANLRLPDPTPDACPDDQVTDPTPQPTPTPAPLEKPIFTDLSNLRMTAGPVGDPVVKEMHLRSDGSPPQYSLVVTLQPDIACTYLEGWARDQNRFGLIISEATGCDPADQVTEYVFPLPGVEASQVVHAMANTIEESLRVPDLACEEYRYSTCPEGCIQTCTSTSCITDEGGGVMCTTDCDGPGSCRCPE